MKKTGNKVLFLISCFTVGALLGHANKKKFVNVKQKSILTLDNYVNRLSEFDISEEKECTNLFFDLIELGFHPDSAFDIVQKESTEAGDIFND